MNDKPSWLLLVFVVLACLCPIFLLAKEVDGDEFAKSGLGLATVGAIVAIVKSWQWFHPVKVGNDEAE